MLKSPVCSPTHHGSIQQTVAPSPNIITHKRHSPKMDAERMLLLHK